MKQDVDDMYPTTLAHTMKVRCIMSLFDRILGALLFYFFDM